MTSTFTPNLGLEKPARGDYSNDWDLPANANYDLIDAAIGGQAALTGQTGGALYLTAAQAANQILTLSGTLTSNLTVYYPTGVNGRKIVINNCTMAGFTIAVRGGGGSDVVGVLFKNALAIPRSILVTSNRVYWDYGALFPGFVASFPINAVPDGWLICDGSAYSTTQYDLLFGMIGYSYGGSGASFNIPDYRGYALVGSDNMGTGSAGRFFNYGVNASLGETAHTLSWNEMPSHNHGVNDGGHGHGVSDPGHAHSYMRVDSGHPGLGQGGALAGAFGDTTGASGTGIGIQASGANISIQNSGSSWSHNNVQPSFTVNKYMRW